MATLRCRVCLLPDPLRAEVHERLIGSPTHPRTSSPKVSAWLLAHHQVEVRYPAINEHLRRGHPGTEGWQGGTPGPRPQGRPEEGEAPESRPRKAKPPAPPPVQPPPPVPADPVPAPPPKRPEVAFLDALLESSAASVMDLNASVRRRINEVPADVTETPGQEGRSSGQGGGKKLPPPGPTDAEARWLTGGLSGIATLLKVRALYTGVGRMGASVEEAVTGKGLKQAMAALGLPPPPPVIEGDSEDPDDDDTIKGYEAASPEPPPREDDESRGGGNAPPPPPSGPRSPAPSPPQAPVLKAVAGGWGSSPWTPPKPPQPPKP